MSFLRELEEQGEIMQVPPRFSAVHVEGQRAYKLSREGKDFELAPRRVKVFSLRLLSYDGDEVRISMDVGSGFYVRSLVRDMGEALHCGGILTHLTRTFVGNFHIEESFTLSRIEEMVQEGDKGFLLPPSIVVGEAMEIIRISACEIPLIRNGNPIPMPGTSSGVSHPFLCVDQEGTLLCVGRIEKDYLKPEKVF